MLKKYSLSTGTCAKKAACDAQIISKATCSVICRPKHGCGRIIRCGSSVRWYDTEAYYSRFQKAETISRQAIDLASRAGSTDSATSYKTAEALREAEVGNATLARRAAMGALGASPSRNRRLDLALVFARTGDTSQAEKLADELNEEFPVHTWIQKYQLSTIRAAIELDRNNPVRALEILQSATPYELASTEAFNSLYPAYVRGLAYLQAGQGHEAAAEFQKLLDHRGVVGNYVTGPWRIYNLDARRR